MYSLIFFFFLFCNSNHVSSLSSSPDRYLKSASYKHSPSQQYLELTSPLPSDDLTPSCTHPVIRHSFANTINSPPYSASYSPPHLCPSPWSFVVLHFRCSSHGDQYDRIAALWLAGVELLRTSTAEPTPSGIFWIVRKDITRYSSLLSQNSLNFTMMLENIVNDVFTGVYVVEVDLLFYSSNYNTDQVPLSLLNPNPEIMNPSSGFQAFYEPPADLIIPISDDGNSGCWFRIESGSDVHSKGIQIPLNTYRAVLELYVSFHGDDEFWYSNPPNSYIRSNTTGRGNGAYREVIVTIDGKFVGSEVPFPVVFTGGINPLFWEPVVSIGAFDLPSYDFDLSPMLEMLLDGNVHNFAIKVADGISYWLVDANLHLWLDHYSSLVEAKSVAYNSPGAYVKKSSQYVQLDGLFEINGKRNTKYAGWVKSGAGNLTTYVLQQLKVKNIIKFEKNGTLKLVKQNIRSKRETRIKTDTGSLLTRVISKRSYPLDIVTSTIPGFEKDIYTLVTNVTHAFKKKFTSGQYSSSVHNSQDSGGWMKVQDHSVLSGAANTKQSYSFKDDSSCYSRIISASNGKLLSDKSTSACLSAL